MTQSVGQAISNQLGNLVSIDSDEEGQRWGRFMRIRVKIDIRKPLWRGMKIMLDDVESFWVDFHYEKLTEFCFKCGFLGHLQKDFRVVDSHSNPQYGVWP